MPIVRRTTSALGNSIVNDVKKFISDNARAMENDTNITPDIGAEAMGHAIAYGIAKALSNKLVQSAFYTGICPPVGGPVGSLMYAPLKSSTTEK